MKKILFAAGITIIGLSAAFAQDVKQSTAPATNTRVERSRATRATPEAIAKARTNRLSKQLSLSSEQEHKIYDLFLKQTKENNGRSVHRDALDKEIKAVLTPDQNQKYEEMKANGRKNVIERNSKTGSTLQAAPASR